MAQGSLLLRLVCEHSPIVRLLMSILPLELSQLSNAKSEVKMKGAASQSPWHINGVVKEEADKCRRIQEFSLALRQTFEEAVQTQLSPRSQIDISVLVLEQDGGVLQTAINAVTLALVDAGIPMNDYICATSAGLVDNNAILGLPLE